MSDQYEIPSDPKERAAIKAALVEITKSMATIEGERNQIKETKKDVKDKYGIGPKIIGKLAKAMYEHSYADMQAENDHFAELWEILVEGKKLDEAA